MENGQHRKWPNPVCQTLNCVPHSLAQFSPIFSEGAYFSLCHAATSSFPTSAATPSFPLSSSFSIISSFSQAVLLSMAQNPTRAQWDDVKDLFAVNHLLKATRLGKKSDTGFKKDVWQDLVTRLAAKFGATLSVGKIQSHIQIVYSSTSIIH